MMRFKIIVLVCLLHWNLVLTVENNQVSTKGKCNNKCSEFEDPLLDLTFQLSGSSLAWPCESTKNIYLQSERFVPRNVIITRAQLKENFAYVAMPRYKHGVPITLGKIALRKGKCLPTIEAFPCWNMQEEGNCQALQSVVDVALDRQGLLWALDVGIVNTLEQPIRHCSPKLVAINTINGKIVKSIDMSDMVTAESQLQYVVVDYSKENKPFIYVSDAGAHAILVFDIITGKSYRVVLPKTISPASDVLYITLEHATNGESTLFFTYLTSKRLYSIKGKVLQTGEAAGAIVDIGAKPFNKQIVLLGSDGGKSLFLRYKGESDIYMWNTNSCFKASNFEEVQNGDDCRLATQVLRGQARFMWSLSSNFHHYISGDIGCNGASIELRPLTRDCDC